jgi:4-amino-4-deoxy-L-arabinose transferase-like glycosyltransferase
MELGRGDTTRTANEPAFVAPAVARWARPLTIIALGLLALVPRVSGLADYLTTDEAYHWITRVERFSAAVSDGRWRDTVLTGHPGVTTMWLGSMGLWLERALLAAGLIEPPTLVQHLAWLRLPSALLQSLLIPAAFLLLRRLLGSATALVACVLWACSPYLVAHSRLLHLDALLTSFVTLSVVFLLQWRRDRQAEAVPVTPSLCLSAIFAGLALLTKGPALILLPFVGLLMLADARMWHAEWRRPHVLFMSIRFVVLRYALWLAIALLTVVALWPALWVAPEAALGRYFGEIVSNGGRPNGDGQFFLGRAVDDPGPLFYPLVNLFRTTPIMLLGLLAYFAFTIDDLRLAWVPTTATHQSSTVNRQSSIANRQSPIVNRQSPIANRQSPIANRQSSIVNRTLLILLAFILFWTLVMTLGPKKFDRYVLPTWPALLILAAAGLTEGWQRLTQRLQPAHHDTPTGRAAGVDIAERKSPIVNRQSFLIMGLTVALELWQPLSVRPYYLSYYNPLLGGGPVAERLFLIGWGEGMDQVGGWLGTQPDIQSGPVLSALGRTLQPFVPVDVRDVEDFGQLPANYAVAYLESVQRAANPPLYAALGETVPLHRVVINGIEYARIHQLARPFATTLQARFGEGLRLRGYTLVREPSRLVLTPAWDVRGPIDGDYIAFVHLLDAQGKRVAELAVAPGGGDAPPTSAWQPGRQFAVPLPLELPADLAPGRYTLILGLFDAATGARLPLAEGPPADPAIAGDNALLVATVER